MKKAKRSVVLDLFGHPIEDTKKPHPSIEIREYLFFGEIVRVVVVNGIEWFVLTDVALILEFRDAFNAGRSLRGKHKGTQKVSTLGGTQELVVISEAGLYHLMGRSNSKKAEAFQDWLEEEVIPSIRRTGRYDGSTRKSPLDRVQRRLGCDVGTAKSRVESINLNKGSHARMAKDGACPYDFRRWHNTAYENLVQADAAKMRKALGQKRGQTPLDRMSELVLTELNHSRSLTERKIAEMRSMGVKLGMDDQLAMLAEITRKIAERDLAELGDGFSYGVIEHATRGPIVDVVRAKLTG